MIICVWIVLANGAHIEEKSDHVGGGALQRGCGWYVFEHGPGPGLWSCECLGYAGQEIAYRFEPEGWLVQCKEVSGGGFHQISMQPQRCEAWTPGH